MGVLAGAALLSGAWGRMWLHAGEGAAAGTQTLVPVPGELSLPIAGSTEA